MEKTNKQYEIFGSMKMAPDLLKEIYENQSYCKELAEIVSKKDIRSIVCVGTGSSYLVSLSQAYAAKEITGLFAEAYNSTDFRLYCPKYLDDHSLVFVNSHSGKSPGDVETERIAKEKGAYVVAVTDIEGTKMTEIADYVFFGPGGKKFELPSTRSYVTALYRFFIFLCHWVKEKNGELAKDCLEELAILPEYCRTLLDKYESEGPAIAEKLTDLDSAIVVAYGTNFSTAQECAMGMTQALKRPSFSYVLEEYLHGPIQGVSENTGVILLSTKGPGEDRMIDFGEVCAKLGMKVNTLVSEDHKDKVHVGDTITFPPVDVREIFSPIYMILPFWMIGYYLTLKKEGNPDLLSMEDPRFIDADIAGFKIKYA